ncbi:precorrin-6Y C5,15-methyltransferase (decarboxylating) [Lachnotalea glycerini]|uniref:Precorrin-6Y C5,15-methyltransferase (Decarboxylating) n=1 Tax=Lachnotalea glycerini TaxID=1763509 RepID=A0A318EU95_9FIRM|nr:precorrin-6A reductase [Lachnotalea glycerini]PXV95812.1 precorrin-6Y C5,15-methyltransferase (decarboxylating) [Lachnotalea glycerini]
MCKLILFAGTTEGRNLAEYLNRQRISIHVCTATEYGESLIPKSEYVEVSGRRQNREEIERLIHNEQALLVVDATHPYATLVSKHIKDACENTGVFYLRLLREESHVSYAQNHKLVYVNSVKEACDYLKGTNGNIFVTTGSKELIEFTNIDHYKKRVYARVLSSRDAISNVMDLGFEGKNLICMQGPFSEELNYEMLKESGAGYLVTKEAGKNGGFLEKINAANRLGITTLVVGRPVEMEGYSYSEVIKIIKEKLGILKGKRKIAVIGIGTGTLEGMTKEAINAILDSEVIFGAARMLDSVKPLHKAAVEQYKKEEIAAYLSEHEEYEKIAILVSGDVGFYSAANGFKEYFGEDEVAYICGISSLSYLCARIGVAWEQVKLISNHGRQANMIDAIRRNSKVFLLTGGKNSIKKLMEDLIYYEFPSLRVWVGENLGYEKEKITIGTPNEIATQEFEALSVLYIENSCAESNTERIRDEELIRGEVPMTKEEIRTVSISKLELDRDSILYDIGAGTGSVSIQAAKKAYEGFVYAIEKKSEGTSLIEQNKKKFKVSNLKIIEGMAPKVLEDLPVPTHAFIGGSSGNLNEIIKILFHKNPNIRVVINAITLETVSEIIQMIKESGWLEYEVLALQVSKAKTVGSYHMMLGQNPVSIITIKGGK